MSCCKAKKASFCFYRIKRLASFHKNLAKNVSWRDKILTGLKSVIRLNVIGSKFCNVAKEQIKPN